MKSIISRILASGLFIVCSFYFISCSGKKTDSAQAYPKNVSIEYKVTSPSGLLKADIVYTNESGSNSSLSNQNLPFTIKFNRSVKLYDIIAVTSSAFSNGSLKLEIIIDGVVKDSKTTTGTTSISGSASYVFQ
jgi:hypothetical protein